MLVIRIEMWPHGDRSRARELGIGMIANVGGTHEKGNYDCVLLKSPEYSEGNANRPEAERITRPRQEEIWRRSRVERFPRGKTHGPWDLLFQALGAMLNGRNPKVILDGTFGQQDSRSGWPEAGE